jgi:hypothetical protein
MEVLMPLIQQRLAAITEQLLHLGPMLPGSLSEQYNVCGTPGCKCKDRANPQKHGPYYQLSFSVRGRSSTLFVKAEDVPKVRQRIARYRQFKQLVMDLTQAYVDLARQQGFRGGRND